MQTQGADLAPGPASRARLAAVRERAEALLDPVWPPLAAPLVARHRAAGRSSYDLKLAHWTIRLEFTADAAYAPVVTMRAWLRADTPFGRLRDVALSPIQGGWSPVFVRDMRTPDELVDALHGLCSEIQAVPEINRHLNGMFASK